MDALPSELIMLFVPDPDTLGRMLLVCKWILAALTAGALFKLTDLCHTDATAASDLNIKVGNGAVTFMMRFDWNPYLVYEKTYGCNVSTTRYTFEELHQLVGFPTYMRATNWGVLFMSGIGWDTVRYQHKYALESRRSGIYLYRRSTHRDTLLVNNLEGNIAHFNTTFIANEHTPLADIRVTGLHLIYKKIT